MDAGTGSGALQNNNIMHILMARTHNCCTKHMHTHTHRKSKSTVYTYINKCCIDVVRWFPSEGNPALITCSKHAISWCYCISGLSRLSTVCMVPCILGGKSPLQFNSKFPRLELHLYWEVFGVTFWITYMVLARVNNAAYTGTACRIQSCWCQGQWCPAFGSSCSVVAPELAWYHTVHAPVLCHKEK